MNIKVENLALFGKTKNIERMIDDLMDCISNGAMIFETGINTYLDGVEDGRCDDLVHQIRDLEVEGNRLRREIEGHLYTDMLIPDSRGDVLSLLEDINYLLGLAEDIFLAITVESPMIDDEFRADFKLLTTAAVKTIESAVLAARAFFRNITAVRDHLGKVSFHEEEADQIAVRLKRKIFASDQSLEKKLHKRYFVDKLDRLADEAEDVGDWLAIYSIKRSL
ncbi:MAG: DUF47 family protein [Gammaproteobacteria bacterium]|nr:DUF47 family protein [Gammaproteobacteria bacterium]HXK56235.1 DUF47 family protein [Gammaproteobacteria bacterium]